MNKNQTKHLESPFYEEVAKYTKRIAKQQILKGAEKYHEPFNPDSWTSDELADHAMEEARDLQVYITGMRDRMRKQDELIKKLDEENKGLKEKVYYLEIMAYGIEKE